MVGISDESASPIKFVFRPLKGRAPAAPPLVLTSPARETGTHVTTPGSVTNEAGRAAISTVTSQVDDGSDAEESMIPVPTTPKSSKRSFPRTPRPLVLTAESGQSSQTVPDPCTDDKVTNHHGEPVKVYSKTAAHDQVTGSSDGEAPKVQSSPVLVASPVSRGMSLPEPQGTSQDSLPPSDFSTTTNQVLMKPVRQQHLNRKIVQLRPNKVNILLSCHWTPTAALT